MGYKVLIARSGKETIEIYEKNSDKIDMVILDMIMPGMGGGETYDRLKKIIKNECAVELIQKGEIKNGSLEKLAAKFAGDNII